MKNQTKFVMLGLLLIPFAALINSSESAYAGEAAVTVTYEESSFDVPVSLSNGSVKSIEVDTDFTSIILVIETTAEEGELKITLPRELIDARIDSSDDEFIIIVEGDTADYEETVTTDSERELTIPIPANAEEVEILGTQVVPEFPIAVMAVMGLLVAAVVAIGRFKNPIRA